MLTGGVSAHRRTRPRPATPHLDEYDAVRILGPPVKPALWRRFAEAAVLEAKNAPAGGPPEDAVFLPEDQEMDGPLRRAVADALPDGTTFSFSGDEVDRTWVRVIGRGDSSDPAVTREVLNTALASLGRPTPGR